MYPCHLFFETLALVESKPGISKHLAEQRVKNGEGQP